MKNYKKKSINLFSLLLILLLSSCSINIMNPSLLSYKTVNTKDSGIKVSAYAESFFAIDKNKLIKEATEKALEKAGPEYDVLTDVHIEEKIRLFSIRYVVSGNAHKSVELTEK